jgi:5-methyltetrahydropteroyltriglutamate--homocysteine methyltransferase
MKRSTDRILTTHVGSLPRPDAIRRLVTARSAGENLDARSYSEQIRLAVDDIVNKQASIGLDVVSDGEFSKPSFLTYVNDRIEGFEIEKTPLVGGPFGGSREYKAFADVYDWIADGKPALSFGRMVCKAPLRYKGQEQLRSDLENLKAAMKDKGHLEAFVPSISPTSLEDWNRNEYYPTQKDYLYALADVMREEYLGIIDAGFLLQIDDPHIATHYVLYPNEDVQQVRRWAADHIEMLNHALRGIPQEKIRWHTCYGINVGPRKYDMEAKEIVDLILKVNAGAYSFEAANSRHEHEWQVWTQAKLPDGKILIPGVITHSNLMIEHPELITERIGRFAKAIGRENIIAGADCGFSTSPDTKEMHPTIVWEKFAALVAGAEKATSQLWGRS